MDITEGLTDDDRDGVSRRHLQVRRGSSGLLLIRQLVPSSKNAAFINPEITDGKPSTNRLAPNTEYWLQPGDTVVVGSGVVTLTAMLDFREAESS